MPPSSFLAALPAAMDAVGTERFEKHLADAIGGALEYDFITMARYSVSGKPRFLIHSHTFPSHMAELYLSQFVDADPYIEHWRSAEEPGVVWLQDIAFSRNRYRTYTDDFLPQIGVRDEIGVFMPAVGRDSVAFFYNNRQRLFSPSEVRDVRQVFDAGAALYRVHIRALLGQEGGAVRGGSPSLGSPPRLTSDTGATIWFTNEPTNGALRSVQTLRRSAMSMQRASPTIIARPWRGRAQAARHASMARAIGSPDWA